MKENEKHGSNEQPAPEKPAKELTEQQIQQRRKMIVFPLMLLVFAAIMWLIFAPSGGEEATEQAGRKTHPPHPGHTRYSTGLGAMRISLSSRAVRSSSLSGSSPSEKAKSSSERILASCLAFISCCT